MVIADEADLDSSDEILSNPFLALIAILFFGVLAGCGRPAHAAVTLLDKDDWKFMTSGFVELDMINDSTRSLPEVAGNSPIGLGTTAAGANGRSQFELRNSQLAFTILPPVQAGWVTKGYIEMDFLGYDPTAQVGVAAGSVTQSEGSFYTSPVPRIRHAYLNAENDGWQILLGQYWTLFGWQPYYFLTTASLPPVAAMTYERTPQVLLMKTLTVGEHDKLQAALAVNRPVQRDAQYPGVDAGLRYAMGGRRSGFVSPSGDIEAQPMSLGVSGTARVFEAPTGGAITDKNYYVGTAVAADALIPILSSSDPKDYGNTLSLVGEFTLGKGTADEFNGWTGGLPQTNTAGNVPNLDPGFGGYDFSGQFQLVHIETWNAQLQYHFPAGWDTFTTWGYGRLFSDNIENIVGTAATGYERSEVFFGNIFHDFTRQIRLALEFDRFRTLYNDGNLTQDNRVQLSAWFRF